MAIPHVEGSAPAVDFTVAPPAGEFAQIRMDAAALREAAAATGGKYYTVETAAQLLDDLPPGRQVPIETLPSDSALEPLAGAAAVSRAHHRRMGDAKKTRNGVE